VHNVMHTIATLIFVIITCLREGDLIVLVQTFCGCLGDNTEL
jgi:hypothetical protein